MRRHGWAFSLGLFLTGAAAAQPPADGDRFPPAPDLPGRVIAQLPGPKSPDADPPADAKPAPLPVLQPVPPEGPAPAVPPAAPAPMAAPASAGLFPPGSPCPQTGPNCRPGCSIGYAEIKEWLLFRSRSRQSGHYPAPYYPPLYAWFPCEPRGAACGVGGLLVQPGCATGPTGPVVPGVVTPVPGAAAATTPPVAHGLLPMPVPEGPAAPASPPLGGGTAVGRCADVLTAFEPVAPGLSFTPGVAPMAKPTTQIKPSSWKPR